MTASNKTAPLYVQFINEIKAELDILGLPAPTSAPTETGLPENNGWVFIEFGPHGGNTPALIVPKSKTRMGVLHSHIDLAGVDGYLRPVSNNGRVVCHFEPNASKAASALASFVTASKRPVAPPTRQSTASKPASQPPLTNVADSQAAELEVASWASAHVGSYSDDEAEEALLAMGRG